MDETARLRGRVVVVTGGGRGIGRLFAQALAAAGATVVVTGRSAGELAATVDAIAAVGGKATATVFDVADRHGVEAGLGEVERSHGRIDVLVNNAGMWGSVANAWEADPEAWWRTMEVHLGGAFHCCRAVLPGMVGRGGGRIINIVSHAGVHRWPTCSAYSVSKAAVIKFTENLGLEARRHGVAVFAVHPGMIAAGLTEQAFTIEAAPDSAAGRARAWVRGELASGRGMPPEPAEAMLVDLAAGAADGLSGCCLTARDDLAALQARSEEIRRGDLLTLGLRR